VFELDFPEITARKAMIISKSTSLKQPLGDFKIAGGGSELHATGYHLVSGDLRDWTKVVDKLTLHGFKPELPTFFISECVLIYMEPEKSDELIRWIGAFMPHSVFVAYEQILPDDAFGKMMLQNLKNRNIELRGVHAHPTVSSQRERYLSAGFRSVQVVDMDECFETYVSAEEKARLTKCEMMDELEEWRLLGRHYCLAWASKDDQFASLRP